MNNDLINIISEEMIDAVRNINFGHCITTYDISIARTTRDRIVTAIRERTQELLQKNNSVNY